MVVCETCNKVLSSKSSLRRHIKYKHEQNKPYQCNHCEWVYINKCDLDRHIKYKHTEIKEFKCPKEDCDSEFAWKTDLKDHIRWKHNNVGHMPVLNVETHFTQMGNCIDILMPYIII
jgi:KRAB domain-containing zinc finger protein